MLDSPFFTTSTLRGWCGSPVQQLSGPLDQLRRQIPRFARRMGVCGDDMVLRQPMTPGERERIVARVSSNYQLVQHHDVLDAIESLLPQLDAGAARVPASVVLSPDGERMDVTVELPCARYVPGDGFDLAVRIRVRNSVDKSCALYGGIEFLRTICTNGMTAWRGSVLRRVHNRPSALEHVRRHLLKGFDQLSLDHAHFEKLLNNPVDPGRLPGWVDEVVAPAWDCWDAARAFHIATTGFDGAVKRRSNVPPHRLELLQPRIVPGACAPAANAYHVMQALSYVASRLPWLHTRETRLAGIATLMEPLLN